MPNEYNNILNEFDRKRQNQVTKRSRGLFTESLKLQSIRLYNQTRFEQNILKREPCSRKKSLIWKNVN